MSKIREAPVELLLTQPREQYVRGNETRIRSQALNVSRTCSDAAAHLEVITWLDDLDQFFAGAEERYESKPHLAANHTRRREQVQQMKYLHLSLLDSLIKSPHEHHQETTPV